MSWGWVVFLGGWVGVDGTSLGQVMVSRPLVAASLTGAALGRPAEGALLGAILEIFALVVLPVGAARYPESGTGAVAATAALLWATPAGTTAGALLLAVVFGLLWEWVGGYTVHLIRLYNARLLGRGVLAGSPRPDQLQRRHLGAIVLDFGRGAVVSVLGAGTGTLLLAWCAPRFALSTGAATGILLISVTAMLGATTGIFAVRRWRWHAFVGGLTCGGLLLLL